jgi:hypothetical protein
MTSFHHFCDAHLIGILLPLLTCIITISERLRLPVLPEHLQGTFLIRARNRHHLAVSLFQF